VAPTGDVGSPSTSGSPGDSDASQFLPKFARSAWVTRFLPTLYAYLGSLNKPWELSEPGSDEVQTIQMLIDIVYPQSGYKVQLNDKIYNMVCIYFLQLRSIQVYCSLLTFGTTGQESHQ
jgi:hypothetical protein